MQPRQRSQKWCLQSGSLGTHCLQIRKEMRVHLHSLFTGFPHQLLKTEMGEKGPGVAGMACVPPNVPCSPTWTTSRSSRVARGCLFRGRMKSNHTTHVIHTMRGREGSIKLHPTKGVSSFPWQGSPQWAIFFLVEFKASRPRSLMSFCIGSLAPVLSPLDKLISQFLELFPLGGCHVWWPWQAHPMRDGWLQPTLRKVVGWELNTCSFPCTQNDHLSREGFW